MNKQSKRSMVLAGAAEDNSAAVDRTARVVVVAVAVAKEEIEPVEQAFAARMVIVAAETVVAEIVAVVVATRIAVAARVFVD